MLYSDFWRAEIARIQTALSYPAERQLPALQFAKFALPFIEHVESDACRASASTFYCRDHGPLLFKIVEANDVRIGWQCLNGKIDGCDHWQYTFGIDEFFYADFSEPHAPTEPTEIDCPDCCGSGQYVGFSRIEICQRCNGAKKIAAPTAPTAATAERRTFGPTRVKIIRAGDYRIVGPATIYTLYTFATSVVEAGVGYVASLDIGNFVDLGEAALLEPPGCM